MKLKQNYVLRNVANTWVVLPMGDETVKFNGMIRLNDTAAFLWKELEKGRNSAQMIDALVKEYDVSPEDAKKSIERFLETLQQIGCVE